MTTTDTATLLSKLRARDVKVFLDGGKLKINAPIGAIDAELKADLAARKDDILAFLQHAETLQRESPFLVPIKPEGHRRPLFVLSGHGGDVYAMRPLARALHPDQPVFGVQPPGLDGSAPLTTIAELARHSIEHVKTVQPKGPYLLAGHCAGGTIAYEAAQQLTAAGERVALLGLIGAPYPVMFRKAPQMCVYVARHARALTTGSWAERAEYFRAKLNGRLAEPDAPPEGSAVALAHRAHVEATTTAAAGMYVPRPYAGELHLFMTAEGWHRPASWRRLARSAREHAIPGLGVDERLLAANVAPLAAALQRALDEAAAGEVLAA